MFLIALLMAVLASPTGSGQSGYLSVDAVNSPESAIDRKHFSSPNHSVRILTDRSRH